MSKMPENIKHVDDDDAQESDLSDDDEEVDEGESLDASTEHMLQAPADEDEAEDSEDEYVPHPAH